MPSINNSVNCSNEFNPHFLYYCLQFHRPRLEQAAARVTLPILNKSNFENFLVAAPEKADQDEVAKVLTSVDEKTAHHRRKHATLSALFRTLLHQLMTAQLWGHDLDLPELGTDTPPAGQIRTFPNQDPTLTKKSVVQ